jgi:hypothetical protein
MLRFNFDLLAKLAGAKGERSGKRIKMVAAMNADRSRQVEENREKRGKVTLTTLDRWITDRKVPPFLDALISLCNNMDDVTLGDFFTLDGSPAKLIKKNTNTNSANSVETITLLAENKYMKDLLVYHERERKLTDVIVDQEKTIKEIRVEMEEKENVITLQKEKIAQLEHHLSLLKKDVQTSSAGPYGTIASEP